MMSVSVSHTCPMLPLTVEAVSAYVPPLMKSPLSMDYLYTHTHTTHTIEHDPFR